MNTLRESGFDVETDALTVEEAAEEIMRRISKSSR